MPINYGFQKIKGLPTDKIYDLLIDRQGFIWMGHELGISRFNGIDYTSFNHPKQSALAISTLREDKFGRIWCRNFNGQIFCIDHEKMQLLEGYTPYANPGQFALTKNELLAGSNKGLFILDLNTNKRRIIPTFKNLSLNIIEDLYSTNNKCYLVLVSNDKKYILEYENGQLTILNGDVRRFFLTIVWANDSEFIIRNGGTSDIYHFYVKNDQLLKRETIHLDDNNSFINYTEKEDELWIHTRKQSYKQKGGDTIYNLALTDYQQDREGNIWASSLVYGLLLKKRAPDWRLIYPSDIDINSIVSLNVFNKRIVAATYDGKIILTDTDKIFNKESSKVISLKQNSTSGIITNNNHLYAYGIPGLVILDTSLQIVKRYPTQSNLLEISAIDSNTFVFGTNKGMSGILLNTTESTPPVNLSPILQSHFSYDSVYRLFINVQGKRVRGICYNPDNKTLYAGFSNGLFAYTDQSVSEIKFNNEPIYAYSIKTYKGLIYAGTLNHGMLIIKDRSIIEQMTNKTGLLSSSILRLKISGSHLWICGLEEIQLYDLEKNVFIPSIVLPPVNASRVYDLLELNNNIYFATTEGIFVAPLYKSKLEKIRPLNYLMSVIANGTDTIRNGAVLSSRQNNLQFNLAGLYYYDAQGTYFKYRLLSSSTDTNWKTNSSGNNNIQLFYLKPGDYTFEAIAHTANKLSADKKITFSFTINKPWWQQMWFVVTCILVISGLSIFFISLRISNRKRAHIRAIEKLQYENALNESELKALKSQMNPHFISNSLNAIQEMFMWGDKNAANEQLGNFAMLTRLVLTVSEKKSIPLSTEVEILKKYLELEKMRFKENFDYKIIINDVIDDGYIHIPPMVIQPFVENSVKHGLLHKKGAKSISIIFNEGPNGEYIICRIRDNGIGRKEADNIKKVSGLHNNGFSIEATEKRLTLMQKDKTLALQLVNYMDLKDEEGTASGTEVEILVPIL